MFASIKGSPDNHLRLAIPGRQIVALAESCSAGECPLSGALPGSGAARLGRCGSSGARPRTAAAGGSNRKRSRGKASCHAISIAASEPRTRRSFLVHARSATAFTFWGSSGSALTSRMNSERRSTRRQPYLFLDAATVRAAGATWPLEPVRILNAAD